MKVLVVDDSTIDLSIIMSTLSKINGIIPLFATTPDCAISIAITEQPDLIIMDVMLPTMDGIELTERLSRHKHTASIPVVFITASEEDKAKDCYRVGCVDFLTKPIDIERLLHIVVHQSFIAKIEDVQALNRTICKGLY